MEDAIDTPSRARDAQGHFVKSEEVDPAITIIEVDDVDPKPIKAKPKKPGMAPEEVTERPEGCEHCVNTGLEPGVGLDIAKYCPICHGSPFIVKSI